MDQEGDCGEWRDLIKHGKVTAGKTVPTFSSIF